MARADDALCVRLTGDWRLARGLPSPAVVERGLEGDGKVRRLVFDATRLGRWDSSLVTFVAQGAPSAERLQQLVEQGLRARLSTLSIVTGVLYVEFDLLPGSPLEMMQEAGASYPEIPTLPTPLEEATKTVSDVLAQLKQVDVKGIGTAVREAVDGVNRLANNPRLAGAIEGLPDAVAAAHRLLVDLDARTAPLGDGLRTVSEDTRQTLASLRATLEAVQAMVAPDAPLAVDVAHAANDLGRAARGLGDLADFLERNPNAVVFGRPKP